MKRIAIYIILVIGLLACNNSKKVEEAILSNKDKVIINKEGNQNIQNKKIVDTIVKPKIIEEKKTLEEHIPEKKPLKKAIQKPIDSLKVETKKVIEKITAKHTVLKKQIDDSKITRKEESKEVKIRPNHSIWNTLTLNNVSKKGKVNYTGFKSKIKDLEKYLNQLATITPQKDWSKNEKLAYWFNLYNASTVKLITQNYPVKSIKDINGGKPWDKKFIISGKNTYSLNEIENTIVRANFNEPRLHVAFNCAAVSCPKLLNGAFIANTLNHQLNMLSNSWINDVSKNIISANEIKISKIFEWYKVDFKEGIIPFVNKYSSQKVNTNAKILYLEYNWALNE